MGPKASVSEVKKAELKSLISRLEQNKTVMVVSIKGLPSRQYQDIKKKLRDKGSITVSKKTLLKIALENSKVEGLSALEPYLTENTAILYSNEDAFVISGILATEKSPQKAKPGQEAPKDIEVKAGPTDLVPGPDISALSAVGLIPKVEGGKIAVMQDKIIAKKGDIINDAVASIMAKLDIIPFEVGIEPVAAFMDGKVYSDITINIDAMVADLEEKFGRTLAFAVDLGYYTTETMDFILSKAGVYEGIITRVITGEPEPVAAPQEEAAPEVKEETKVEEKPAESAAGLASLF